MLGNKKAQGLFDLIVWIVIAFVVLLFFAGWKLGFGMVTNELLSVQTPDNDLGINISDTAGKSFGVVNTGLNGLHLLAFALFFGMGLSILLSNFLIKVHPAFFIIFVLVTLVAIILSFYISNVYTELSGDSVFGSALNEFKMMSFVMTFLPLWVTVIGFLSAIFLYSGMMRDAGQGGGF
jgi:hypothetical protein